MLSMEKTDPHHAKVRIASNTTSGAASGRQLPAEFGQ